MTIQKITPFLWFDTQAEEAAKLYVSLFPDSKINVVSRYGEGMPAPEGTVMVVSFTLAGQEFTAMNGGPQYKFNESISLMVNCETQEEIDKYWNALTADGGKEVQCGWLKDKYGLSWQITPSIMGKLMSDPDREKAGRTAQAMMKMVKLDIAALQQAHDGS